MLCERCNKNRANIHITKIVNGHKLEQNLCEKCAKEGSAIGFGNDLEAENLFSFPSLLGGLVDYISKSQTAQSQYKQDLICKNCGTSYNEFKKNGLLGCSVCYEEFCDNLLPVVKRIQGNIEHVGKLPKSQAKDIEDRRVLVKLKEDLQKSIALEEYEKAAEIRDKIRKIEREEWEG
ncbi:UvrB/UvrC motif-containing protein [Hathewaya histolytica]|uniref:UvrB/UvrC domain-containing protein n=1 Tax=Hathewaya histolytica TaxID=1498 RepID=A0A4U9RSD0_HATHI|nr:UvrB/UvrC motif-containing protein [Hathewaya histolytica]VTQ95245.1 UvrB/UvrC domain-containing protein [Hathewaya histolytica]